MDGVQVESVELDEQLWQQWVEKGKQGDEARKRRWRIPSGVVGGTLLIAIAEVSRGALLGAAAAFTFQRTARGTQNSPDRRQTRF
jgi:hypothetical protein